MVKIYLIQVIRIPLSTFILLLFLLACNNEVEKKTFDYPFQNPALPVDERIDDLIGRLTLKEKASLMLYNSPAIERLGIPAYNWWNECLHGVARAGEATVFPQAIGLAATFDDDLIFRVADAISDEARAKHHLAVGKGNRSQYSGLSFWTPNINIFRDPRWGRGQETYGEDPFLTSKIGVAFVKGLQGNNPEYLKVSACAKHFAVHSGPEKIRHRFNALPSERDFRETYLPAFEALVKSGVESVMCAYNRTYDKPCCGSGFLLDTILRKEWGFKGHVVSDCWALDDIRARHKVVVERVQATAMAAKAGVNLNCGYLYKYLPAAVDSGLIDESIVDKDLRPMLRTRFKLGLFDTDDMVPYSKIPADVIDSEEHRKLALETAGKSIVLLKNKNGILPINSDTLNNLLVVGPTALDVTSLLGNYNGFSKNMVTIFEGITDRAGKGTTVGYSQGFLFHNDSLMRGFWEAGMADAVVVCIGINSLFEGEEGDAMLNPYGGDRKKIELPPNQVKYVKKMRAMIKNKPLIVVVTGGSAIALGEVEDLADAILFVWYPGEEGGSAVADIIFGNINPSGRLPVTFYKSTSDLPPFEDYSMEGRTYKYFRGEPLYPFGYGLSYSAFSFDGINTAKNIYANADTITLSVKLSNKGPMDGEEVIQVYARKANPAPDDPVEVLAGFKRAFLRKNSQETVEMKIPVKSFARWNSEKQEYITPAGRYFIGAGKNSAEILQEVEILVK